jgi:hypothetical protein
MAQNFNQILGFQLIKPARLDKILNIAQRYKSAKLLTRVDFQA